MGYLRVFACSIVLALLTLQIARAQTDITAQLTFTTIDVPGAGATTVRALTLPETWSDTTGTRATDRFMDSC